MIVSMYMNFEKDGKKEMKKIALCIPTYNGAQYVKEFLNEYAQIYLKHGIDIFYFDSSPINDTKNIVETYCKEKNVKNIFFRSFFSNTHSNKKVYLIYQDKELTQQYEYIWVCSDAIRFSEAAIEQLEQAMGKKYDLINLNPRDYENIGDREYLNINEFFKDCAWELTLYGSAILKSSSMLSSVNWEYFERKFLNWDMINFSHVGFYFERLLELRDIRVRHLSIAPNQFKSSMYKKHSAWYKDCFTILCYSWPHLVNSLSNEFTDKKSVICQQGMYTLLKNEKDLLHLRYDGVLDIKEFVRYSKMWSQVCRISVFNIMLISLYPQKLLSWKFKHEEERIIQLFKGWSNQQKDIYIYGAGNMGYIVLRYLHEKNIPITGFCVSNKLAENVTYQGYPVCHYAALKENMDCKFVLALTPINADKVLKGVSSGEKTRIYYNKTMLEDMQFFLGYR